MKRPQFIVSLLLLSLMPAAINAQPFADEIAAFKKEDSLSKNFTGSNLIVFTGSSSIRLWRTLHADFAGSNVLNRGFGGSTLPDMVRYAADIILKYSPRQVFIYCGENDLVQADSVTAKIVFGRFKKLYFMLREKLPDAHIAYISIKPSPSRRHIQPAVMEANSLINAFLKNERRTAFIDIYSDMLHADGSMRGELFTSDSLHMNEKGYALWQKKIEPYLIR